MDCYTIGVFFTRKFKIDDPEPPQDVKDEFNKYADGGAVMTAEQLQRFLVDVQGEAGVSVAQAEQIVNQALQKQDASTEFDKHTLTLEDFHDYLFSAKLNPPIRDQVHHDMTAPLSHYFIFTGHNSYLTGNQLSSDSSDVPIIKALKKGLRVVELDLWPDSDEDEVEVLHGRTLTTPVKLIKCLESIKENAFVASPYPVIITLEDHLTPNLQDKVAKMITQTFGDMVFLPDSDCLKEFPSPEELRYKIIISTKPPKQYPNVTSINEKRNNSKGKSWLLSPRLPLKIPKSFKRGNGASQKEPSSLPSDQEDEEKINDGDTSESSQDDEDNDSGEPGLIPSKAPEYKHLIAIQASKAKGVLKNALKVEPDKVKRLSLSEQKLEKVTESHGTHVVRFTQKNVLRIYPRGSRFNSSNYNPLIGWKHGAQMVAFNMQGYDKYLWWMQGMFRSNGGCGYIKKPQLLMEVGPDGQVFDPKAKCSKKTTLKVKVYMGEGWRSDFKPTHFDSYSPPDFYTRVGIVGVLDDKKMHTTETKEDKWNPVWDEEFTFELTVPELALLRVEVREHNDIEKHEFAGQTCLLVSELKQGIRAVPLYNKKGDMFKSVRLLMRFDFV
ncbi:hypothetical protein SLE2022_001520 [Rubroshorea leprosula]